MDEDEHIYDRTKNILNDIAFNWMGPIFFINLGTKLVIEWDILGSQIGNIFILFFALIISQVLSAGLSA